MGTKLRGELEKELFVNTKRLVIAIIACFCLTILCVVLTVQNQNKIDLIDELKLNHSTELNQSRIQGILFWNAEVYNSMSEGEYVYIDQNLETQRTSLYDICGLG